jgi:hypothetical protein
MARQATSGEVKDLRAEAAALKEAVADLTLEKNSGSSLVNPALLRKA